jgi:tripartite-type tricarboxylate transporter receptor subunit TctC
MDAKRRTVLRTAGLLAVPLVARAQSTWSPTRPVRIIIPTSPGSTMDTIARLVAQRMGETLGQPVVAETQAGANGRIGAEHVARSAPDGHTMMINSPSTTVVASFLTRGLPFDAYKDFTPITAAADPVTCLAIHPSVPAQTLQEFVAWAKKNPGRVTLGTSGVGGVFHLMGELFKRETGVETVHVPYKGVAPAVAATVQGEVNFTFSAVNNIIPHWKAGKLRVLTVLYPTRYAEMPGVPAVTEIYPSMVRPASWFGFFGPANLPPPVLGRLNTELVRALRSPDVRQRIEAGGSVLIANSPQEFAAMFKESFAIYGKVIREAGIKPEE